MYTLTNRSPFWQLKRLPYFQAGVFIYQRAKPGELHAGCISAHLLAHLSISVCGTHHSTSCGGPAKPIQTFPLLVPPPCSVLLAPCDSCVSQVLVLPVTQDILLKTSVSLFSLGKNHLTENDGLSRVSTRSVIRSLICAISRC